MKKQEFLDLLKNRLWALPERDIQQSLDYYKEMIDDRMEDGLSEDEAVAAVGDLDEIVEQITSEAPGVPAAVNAEPKVQPPKQEKQRRMAPWAIVLVVLGSPLWLPLLIAVGSVIFAVFVSLWAVVIALYATTFALGVSALGLLVAAFSQLWIRRFAECAVTVGGAFICAGATILLFLLSNLAAKGLIALIKLIWRGATGGFHRKEQTV